MKIIKYILAILLLCNYSEAMEMIELTTQCKKIKAITVVVISSPLWLTFQLACLSILVFVFIISITRDLLSLPSKLINQSNKYFFFTLQFHTNNRDRYIEYLTIPLSIYKSFTNTITQVAEE